MWFMSQQPKTNTEVERLGLHWGQILFELTSNYDFMVFKEILVMISLILGKIFFEVAITLFNKLRVSKRYRH